VYFYEESKPNEPKKATKRELERIRELFDRSYMMPLALAKAIGFVSRDIRNTRGIKARTVDSTIVATAIA